MSQIQIKSSYGTSSILNNKTHLDQPDTDRQGQAQEFGLWTYSMN